jgi:O-antigen ligase
MVACLALSQSRGSIVGAVAAFAVVAALQSPLVAAGIAAMGAIAIAFLAQPGLQASAIQLAGSLFSRSGRTDELTTLTGRSDIWAAVFDKYLQHPWFGYGLASPRKIIPEAYKGPYGATYQTAHNAILESLVSFGAVGTAVLVVAFGALGVGALICLRRLRQAKAPAQHVALARCVLRCWILLLVAGLVETGLAGMPSPDTVMLALLAGTPAALLWGLRPEAARSSAASSSGDIFSDDALA